MEQKHVNLIGYFDSIRIINLAHRDDRRKEVQHELAKLSMQEGENNVKFYLAIKPEDAGGFTSAGARGCFMSHLEVLRQARDERVDKLLILEDDVDFIKKSKDVLPSILTELNSSEWDICYFGHRLSIESQGDSLLTPYTGNIQTAHFYAVNGKIIPRLITFLELLLSRPPGHPDGGPKHVDGAISTFRAKNPEFKTLVLRESIGYQRPSKTDIHTLKFYDRVPLLTNIIQLIRKVKRGHKCFMEWLR